MTTPTIVPAKYAGLAVPQLIAKIDRSGAQRFEAEIVSIPTGTTVGTIIGLIPFRAGAMFDYGSVVFTDALGAGVTVSLGYIYTDNVTFTNNLTAFTALTAATAAATLQVPNVPANVTWRAPLNSDGWIVLVIGGATTGTTNNVSTQITLVYDQP